MDKRQIYSQKEVVKNYDKWRFGGKSGNFVNQKELGTIEDILKGECLTKIIDLPCGTGRLARFLIKKNPKLNITGADYSLEMLNLARDAGYQELIRADAFKLPFDDNSFDCFISLRFIFHYQNIKPFFKEVKRILKKGGILIFDTYRWSPYQILGFFLKKYRKRVFIHSEKNIKKLLNEFKFEITSIKKCFLFSPLIYRFLPYFALVIFEKIEKIIPKNLLTKAIYKTRKI